MTASTDPVVTPRLRAHDGRILELPVDRWLGRADAAEHRALDHAVGPALDVGCGPGRHLVALAERRVFALGIDISGPFLEIARGRAVNVLRRSVFERVPGAGRWRCALLLDGNIGIGGEPLALLARITDLLRGDGRIIVETDPHDDGDDDVVLVRAETGDAVGPWFRWTTVGPRRLVGIARSLDLRIVEAWEDSDRHFARLDVHRR
jgi:SAM-dependent methyltransferase